jgi:ribonuclease HI
MSKYHDKKTIIVFTDGSCSGNGRHNAVGGIGIHFPNGELNDISKIYKSKLCTNQKTELYAILTALRYIRQNFGLSGYKVIIKTDSKYSIDCITKWVNGWKKNGWLTKNKTPVANREYIELLSKYYDYYDIEFEHVDAHTNGDDDDSIANGRADSLATRATERALQKQKSEDDTYETKPQRSRGSKRTYRRKMPSPDMIFELVKGKRD